MTAPQGLADDLHAAIWHELKTDPDVFDAVAAGIKTYEIRRNDRGFQVGDGLLLRRTRYTGGQMHMRPEACPLEYTGETERRVVSHILSGYGLEDHWVILSFAAIAGSTAPPAAPRLTVWYGSMPESNGKKNWTAILHRADAGGFMSGLTDGITIERSEYPDRVRYEADRMRHLIGELAEAPDLLDYDPDLFAPGIAAPVAQPGPKAVGVLTWDDGSWTFQPTAEGHRMANGEYQLFATAQPPEQEPRP